MHQLSSLAASRMLAHPNSAVDDARLNQKKEYLFHSCLSHAAERRLDIAPVLPETAKHEGMTLPRGHAYAPDLIAHQSSRENVREDDRKNCEEGARVVGTLLGESSSIGQPAELSVRVHEFDDASGCK